MSQKIENIFKKKCKSKKDSFISEKGFEGKFCYNLVRKEFSFLMFGNFDENKLEHRS